MIDEFNGYYIKIRTILEIDAKTICEELTTALGPDVPAYPTVAKWTKRFGEVREDVNGAFRSGRPIRYLQMKVSKKFDKLPKMIRIQPMLIS
ncbi:unnamed protein product [Didymodactylos carnosus]|uniref:Mos1 transposase HTH domain-containing protein n=1 Tax=Didymodactylos carnosus TaxID=1234261 RepID=A0A814GW03_9BILA|nr:unnamed protein product [Didymodactylos carnosus]CAF3772859.1 unnamed protein product [Didymodactylos carnosus]